MEYLVTSSGYIVVPPSGLTIVVKSLQLDTIQTSGSIAVSGSLDTFNDIFTAISPIVIDLPFLQGESVSFIPTSGTAIINYIYGGEPEAYIFGKSAQEYSGLSGIVPLWNTVVLSGSYQKGFGG